MHGGTFLDCSNRWPGGWNPKGRAPIWLNAEVARTYLPRTIKKRDLIPAGRTKAQTVEAVAPARAPRNLICAALRTMLASLGPSLVFMGLRRSYSDLAHTLSRLRSVQLILGMNRFVQIAAILVIALLVGYPIAEGFACSLYIGLASRCCSKHMSDLSPDCLMEQQTAVAGCVQNCCSHAHRQTAVVIADPAKPKTELAKCLPAAALTAPSVEVASAVQWIQIAASSSPIYILNRVLRI